MSLNIQFFAGEEIIEEVIPAVEEQVQETTDPELPVFKSKEDYNKLLQSTSSKAKNELLKEIGLGSVAEIKEAVSKTSTLDELAKELDLSKTQIETLRNELVESQALIQKTEDDKLLKTFGIAEEDADVFFGLVDADKSDLSRQEKAKNVKIKIAKLAGVEVKFGTEKQLGTNTDDEVKKEMKRLQKL